MVVDALEFAAAGRTLEGSVRAAEFVRLCRGLPEPQDGRIAWRLAGRAGGQGGRGAWLDVQADGVVRVVCQRCLAPFGLGLRVSRTLGLLDDAAQLEAMDALESRGEGPDIEYIVAEERLDVLALVEDELILALPYAPRHDRCPGAPGPGGAAAQGEPATAGDPAAASPFAVLERLRKD